MTNMNMEIGVRLREMRELAELSSEALAERLGVSAALLASYEAGEADVPVAVLHEAAAALGVSTTELLTGETARLHQYAVMRANKGVAVSRRETYDYRSLGYNFEGRQMDPYLITIQPQPGDAAPRCNIHGGQEFHYCLEGSFLLQIGSHSIILGEGDSVYFDSSCPHGMVAQGGKPARSLVIITM
ncbi:MAG: XRE family transcriptional regulator [Oscillospiraceae bacterium]|jgi:transcriptional regulator with XRE-family HTH domain|nr:XRE family transcriptional regulator [Oscillospiraceae bacterium]